MKLKRFFSVALFLALCICAWPRGPMCTYRPDERWDMYETEARWYVELRNNTTAKNLCSRLEALDGWREKRLDAMAEGDDLEVDYCEHRARMKKSELWKVYENEMIRRGGRITKRDYETAMELQRAAAEKDYASSSD